MRQQVKKRNVSNEIIEFFHSTRLWWNACLHLYSNKDDLTLIMKSTLFCIRIVMIIVTSHILHASRYIFNAIYGRVCFLLLLLSWNQIVDAIVIISFYMNFVIRWPRVKCRKDIFFMQYMETVKCIARVHTSHNCWNPSNPPWFQKKKEKWG